MDDNPEKPDAKHSESQVASEQRPLTTENLANHNLDTDDSHDSGSSNDQHDSDQVDNTTTTEEGNLQHDDTPMQRWRSSNDDRPICWETKDENSQGDATK